ncbi:MAG: zinc ribbon domain-containing protein [Roseburia sp.]|nr:zinc ribbon domain-containing protein [Roseburia sp.]
MAFLDVLGKKISQTGQEVVQKTKDTAEVIKYNSMISDEEHRIDNLYNQIGKTYVELHADSYEEAFAEAISGIKEAQAKISEYREHIIQVKGVFACPNCGEELPLGVAFCSACGSKMEKPETPAENTATRYCQSCGTPMQDGYVFCINCGTKYEEPVVQEPIVEKPVMEEQEKEDITESADATIE